jgi:hypothetical protein
MYFYKEFVQIKIGEKNDYSGEARGNLARSGLDEAAFDDVCVLFYERAATPAGSHVILITHQISAPGCLPEDAVEPSMQAF